MNVLHLIWKGRTKTPIKDESVNKNMKKKISKIIEQIIDTININFCLSSYNRSVKAISQQIRNSGIVEYPITKDVSGFRFVLKKIIIIKLTASGIQAVVIPIQDNPTNIKSLVLY